VIFCIRAQEILEIAGLEVSIPLVFAKHLIRKRLGNVLANFRGLRELETWIPRPQKENKKISASRRPIRKSASRASVP
jgi:hypothetical protein